MIVTTTDSINGYNIREYLDVITEYEFFRAYYIRHMYTYGQAYHKALESLQSTARALGADAIVGIKVNITPIRFSEDEYEDTHLISLTGTPVKLDFINNTDKSTDSNSIKTDGNHYDESAIAKIERSSAEAHGEEADSGSSDGNDDLIDEAIKLVAYHQRASTSFIQRKLKIGYWKAIRILDALEERGIVGPDLGDTKGREVKIDKYQYNE